MSCKSGDRLLELNLFANLLHVKVANLLFFRPFVDETEAWRTMRTYTLRLRCHGMVLIGALIS